MNLLTTVREALDDLKAVNVTEFDVHNIASFTDYMIICSGNSSQHVKSIATRLRQTAKEKGFTILGMEGDQTGEWVLLDLGDVVVHIMQPSVREYYQLERLWSFEDDKKTDEN